MIAQSIIVMAAFALGAVGPLFMLWRVLKHMADLETRLMAKSLNEWTVHEKHTGTQTAKPEKPHREPRMRDPSLLGPSLPVG